MDIDFSLILTLAVLVTGALWAFDAALLKPRRQRDLHAAQAAALAQGSVLTEDTTRQILREPWLFETAHGFFPVLAVVWLLRSFLAEPFTIPSGSMLPSLEVGDYVLVNKFSYGVRLPVLGTEIIPVGLPRRGDVMVFRFPAQPSVNYIKRVIGLPGDRIQVRGGMLHINGEAVKRERIDDFIDREGAVLTRTPQYVETLPNGRQHRILEVNDNGPLDDTPVYVVPTGHFFAMGDNRDNSLDSRVQGAVGYIPAENLVGRAEILFFSTDGSAAWYQFWKWLVATRFGRLFSRIT